MRISKLMIIDRRRINDLYQDHMFGQRGHAKEIELIFSFTADICALLCACFALYHEGPF